LPANPLAFRAPVVADLRGTRALSFASWFWLVAPMALVLVLALVTWLLER
jgi:hypothetical protein